MTTVRDVLAGRVDLTTDEIKSARGWLGRADSGGGEDLPAHASWRDEPTDAEERAAA